MTECFLIVLFYRWSNWGLERLRLIQGIAASKGLFFSPNSTYSLWGSSCPQPQPRGGGQSMGLQGTLQGDALSSSWVPPPPAASLCFLANVLLSTIMGGQLPVCGPPGEQWKHSQSKCRNFLLALLPYYQQLRWQNFQQVEAKKTNRPFNVDSPGRHAEGQHLSCFPEKM